MASLDQSQLDKALAEPPFSAADRAIVRYLSEDLKESNNWILFAGALANLAIRQGHAFLDLEVPQNLARVLVRYAHDWPTISQWESYLADSPALGIPSSEEPLVLQKPNALYLRKYFHHEERLSQLLSERCVQKAEVGSAKASLIQTALSQSFFVITGGPGTGKTTIALQYLKAFLESWKEDYPARIAAVAPTGKAAARLEESIGDGIGRLDASEPIIEELKKTPTLTIHRLLGTIPNQVSFKRDQDNQIDYDIIVIDECSMIDLPLMRRLFEATPADCATLLLGDKDQLSSVQVGSVFKDILHASEFPGSSLHDKVYRLSKTYRFREDSRIYQACQAARSGNVESLATLAKESSEDFAFIPLEPTIKRLPKSLIAKAVKRIRSLADSSSPQIALSTINQSIILTTTRVGPFGSSALNQEIEKTIRGPHSPFGDSPIHACPIIVLENNYELELFNGDLGILWKDKDERYSAWFASASGAFKRVSINDLPKHETAFALTIHKSQGSEFDETTVLISPQESDLLSRELIYTAFSRSKTRLEIYANPETLNAAIQRQVHRATRLADR
ncbi:MAG: exodeoxyribonuclease V subunit alpha, partial [Verrucomicrobiota bacterium]